MQRLPKPGMAVLVLNSPTAYPVLVPGLPDGLSLVSDWMPDLDLVHIFTDTESEMAELVAQARAHIRSNGVIWVSWPKKSSGVRSDITEDTIRNFALRVRRPRETASAILRW